MRPDRFRTLLLDATPTHPGAEIRALTEADRARFPCGVEVRLAGKTTRWQIVAVSAPGDRYDQPEASPVLGPKPAPPEQAPAAAGTPAHLESVLAAAVLAADPGEFAAVTLYSQSDQPPEIGHGFTLACHNGAKIMLYHR